MNINIISALCRNNGIGYRNKLPWHYSKDMKYFAQLTKNKPELREKNAVLMGRNTWNSLPKPLPNRSNYIISNTCSGNGFFDSIDGCLEHCRENKYSNVWIIGGETIYCQTISKDYIDKLYLTRIDVDYDCDTFFPTIPNNYALISEVNECEKNSKLVFEIYANANT